MRPDMKKVLTERPRSGDRSYARDGVAMQEARYRLRVVDPEEGECFGSTRRVSMARGGSKSFTDLIGPLYRFLEVQVGRPWDDVWSEVCKTVDATSTQGKHLRGHAEDYVVTAITMVDGVPYERSAYGRIGVLGSWLNTTALYVNPETGVLCSWDARSDLWVFPDGEQGRLITFARRYLGRSWETAQAAFAQLRNGRTKAAPAMAEVERVLFGGKLLPSQLRDTTPRWLVNAPEKGVLFYVNRHGKLAERPR